MSCELAYSSSQPKADIAKPPMPKEIIDLGILVTEDMPESLWGKRFLADMGFDRNNSFEVIDWEFGEGAVSGSNAYLTLFNHGGPHVDAPNHVGLGAGLDSYSIEAFVGPPLNIKDSDGMMVRPVVLVY